MGPIVNESALAKAMPFKRWQNIAWTVIDHNRVPYMASLGRDGFIIIIQQKIHAKNYGF